MLHWSGHSLSPFLNLASKALYDVTKLWEMIFGFLLKLFCIREAVVFKTHVGGSSSTDWPTLTEVPEVLRSSHQPPGFLSPSSSWQRALLCLSQLLSRAWLLLFLHSSPESQSGSFPAFWLIRHQSFQEPQPQTKPMVGTTASPMEASSKRTDWVLWLVLCPA